MVSEKVTVVVPTIREHSIKEFLDAWREQLVDCNIIIVEDNFRPQFKIDEQNVKHYAHDNILHDLKDIAWIIPKHTSAVRSYGIWKAYEGGADIIISLDDDCMPDDKQFIEKHVARLNNTVGDNAWESTLGNMKPRGYPYLNTNRTSKVMLNHGLWSNVPDYDAVTQLMTERVDFAPYMPNKTIPRGKYFPMCGMNVAFCREIAPLMYHMLQGPEHPYDRFDDIWCGLFMKKVCDHLGYAVTSGEPLINHSRASNVWKNLTKEASGLEVNDTLWQHIDAVMLTKDNIKDSYIELAEKLNLNDDYFVKLKEAMKHWAGLF